MDNKEILISEPRYYSKEDLNAYLLDFISRYLSDNLQEVNCPSALIEVEIEESEDYAIVDELHKRLWIANDIIANLIIAAVKKTDTSLKKLIEKALPEVDSLYNQMIMKKPKIRKSKLTKEYYPEISKSLILSTYKEHEREYSILTINNIDIVCPLIEGREKTDFRKKVLMKIALGDGIQSHSMNTDIISILKNINYINKLK